MSMPTQKPGRSYQAYATPVEFIKAAHTLLGVQAFGWDLAADRSNTVAPRYWTEADDSLSQDWSRLPEGWNWLNPPYSNITPWVKKASEAGETVNVAVLIPASVGANWWRNYVHQKGMVYLLNGRLAFMRDHPTWLYPKDCALILYGPLVLPGYTVWSWSNHADKFATLSCPIITHKPRP